MVGGFLGSHGHREPRSNCGTGHQGRDPPVGWASERPRSRSCAGNHR
ncbi:hypothetical protein L837_0480 [Mycobacterium avium MAV_061107_1842]|nr:hypothetical protein L837_0480 [Mycobacterium avium MAV_061107_1842]